MTGRRSFEVFRRHLRGWLWAALAFLELLMGAYLGDTYGWGLVILTVVVAVVVAAFHRSRQHTRRRVRH